ncbi:DNA glycosylase [Parathielavia appendiculata]|uniref:Adenine DNA glycosylase n=1 Tax=Parathielavia appendiculata TaxID=2587402 RepID=A0AAN6YZG0_9PEZI|nr:DNA glycosylase [Parathielavia appendiculata]
MPWRKPFLPPSSLSRADLSRRAYEVWISETMLQQTRVATVVGYYQKWMARWPTIWDLAAATEEDVVGMWAGLGYYSRARRVWEAARMVCCVADGDGDGNGGVLPGDVDSLMRLPGVGRYSAGAVAAIVFGVAAPVVDGNVLRVLSRQMGVLGDVKADRTVVELLWAAAGELVKAVAGDGVSERPGHWGQALMELGSTVCMPKPNCTACPITETCRAYAEGLALANRGGVRIKEGVVEDVEDLCTLCAPLEETAENEDEGSEPASKPSRNGGILSRFFATTQTPRQTTTASGIDARTMTVIINHARKFPLKKPKKRVREEETLVCAIRRASDGRYLIHQRPAKGLLAGLWELPSHTLPVTNDSSPESRRTQALPYVAELVATQRNKRAVKHVCEIGSVPWLFSHLKLTMHVHLFEIDDAERLPEQGPRERWASAQDIETESMGTGMKRCWALVKKRIGETTQLNPARPV